MDSNNVFLNTSTTNNAPKIFFFPHSGSGPGAYMNWQKHLTELNILGVQYPGRGSRIMEDFSSSILELVTSLFNHYDWQSLDREYFFFGHSLGSIIAYELARKIDQNNLNPPKSVIISALPSPSSKSYKERVKIITRDDAINMISAFSSEMKDEFTINTDLLEMFMEIINADISLLNTYTEKEKNSITSNLHVLGGQDDSITIDQLKGWKKHTSSKFSLDLFDGGHFYFNNNFNAFIAKLKKIILTQIEYNEVQHL